MNTDIEDILDIEARRTQALLDGDAATLADLTGDDYTHVETGGGTRDKAGFLAILARPGVRFSQWVIEENQVRVYVRREGRWQNVAHQATAITVS